MDDPFEAIAEATIAEAENVDVSFEMFVDGLKTIADAIRHRHESATEELDAMTRRDGKDGD